MTTASELFDELESTLQRYAETMGDKTLEDIAYVNAEREMLDRLTAYGDARAAEERERCLAAIAGLYHGDACRASIRSLSNADQPGV